MANVMRYAWGPKVERAIKKTGTVAIAMGDMVWLTANEKIKAISTTTQYSSLVGVAMSASPATDPTATVVKVYEVGHGTVFKMSLASGSTTTAFTVGQAFKLTSAYPQQLTKYGTGSINPWVSASNVVARCAEEMEASGSSVYVTFLPNKYQRPVVNGVKYTSTVMI